VAGFDAVQIAELIGASRQARPAGYRGALVVARIDDTDHIIQLLTIQQLRWLIWAKPYLDGAGLDNEGGQRSKYFIAVSDYLYAIDDGDFGAVPPKAVDYGLDPSMDFYAEPPDYVIEGYDNYKNFLARHAAIHTDFANGVEAFIPGDSLLRALESGAPREAFPNKELPMLQAEYGKFFERGGTTTIMQTLTRESFDTLPAGDYFFGVGLDGTVRIGRELLREEVARIEAETGRKAPRANHAFLFPGEPLLAAGAIYIERDSLPHLADISAQSGHYFYSNVSATVREDIAVRSDHYLLTLGHLFSALDSLGIAYEPPLVRKM
jgi:hypothetical protein